MTNKTKKQLITENEALKAQIDLLINDPIFGVITRQGLPIKLEEHKNNIKYACFIDIDFMHDLNNQYGYEGVNARIKNSLVVRSNDLLIKSRWFSGDEIIFLLDGSSNPEGFLTRLQESFKNNGINFTAAYTDFSGDIEKDINKCAGLVQTAKVNNLRGTINQ